MLYSHMYHCQSFRVAVSELSHCPGFAAGCPEVSSLVCLPRSVAVKPSETVAVSSAPPWEPGPARLRPAVGEALSVWGLADQ